MSLAKTMIPKPQVLNPLPSGTRALLRSGSNAVAYHIPIAPSSDSSVPLKTTISLPRHSAWTSGLHFHAQHIEYLRLVKGAIFVELGGITKCISALAGGEIDPTTGELARPGLVLEIPRYARHNWGRLEHYSNLQDRHQVEPLRPEDWTEEVVVEEWTDPSDISKPLFFWNLNGIITAGVDAILPLHQRIAEAILQDWWIDLQLFQVFWELDNSPIFLDCKKLLPSLLSNGAEIAISFIVLLIARVFGFLLGLREVEHIRTPDMLWDAYRQSKQG